MGRRTPEDVVDYVVSLYNSGVSVGKLSRDCHLSPVTVRRVLRERGVVLGRRDYKAFYVPTEEEIRQRAEAISSSWTLKEERRRRVYKVGRYRVPEYSCKIVDNDLVFHISGSG